MSDCRFTDIRQIETGRGTTPSKFKVLAVGGGA